MGSPSPRTQAQRRSSERQRRCRNTRREPELGGLDGQAAAAIGTGHDRRMTSGRWIKPSSRDFPQNRPRASTKATRTPGTRLVVIAQKATRRLSCTAVASSGEAARPGCGHVPGNRCRRRRRRPPSCACPCCCRIAHRVRWRVRAHRDSGETSRRPAVRRGQWAQSDRCRLTDRKVAEGVGNGEPCFPRAQRSSTIAGATRSAWMNSSGS